MLDTDPESCEGEVEASGVEEVYDSNRPTRFFVVPMEVRESGLLQNDT